VLKLKFSPSESYLGMTKLSPAQNRVLEAARNQGGRVFAADFMGRPDTHDNSVRQSAFWRTAESLVRKGLLKKVYSAKTGFLISGAFDLVTKD
jgi:hypothetical protein